jgi:FkbM family methyltransferase
MSSLHTKLKGLYLNTAKANCSIHESGRMSYDCLVLSNAYTLDYQELDENSRDISLDYDFYIFNYHNITMGWLDTKFIKQLPGLKATIVLEVAPNNPFLFCSKDDFDAYLVLDPTLQSIDTGIYPFPRPLEQSKFKYEYMEKEVPEIGTFGFATAGKGFDKVIDAVNKEFNKAVVNINIPKGDYVSQSLFDSLNNELKNHPTKKDVKVVITNHFFDKEQLIEWCAQNTLNVFLYNRNIQGLSATTDQAIASGRPLAVSTDNTFRHIHTYLAPYPFVSLKDSTAHSQETVLKIQQEWAPTNFARAFEKVLKDFKVSVIEKAGNKITLPKKVESQVAPIAEVKTFRFTKSDFVPPIVIKGVRKAFRKKAIQPSPSLPAPALVYKPLEPFTHYALHSFSQFNEDLLIDLLLGIKAKGIYVDVGANDPSFNSNTKRFYTRGWTGINIEPNKKAYDKIVEQRTNDVNLNVAVSEQEGELTFYNLSNDSTLSTLDYATAEMMADRLDLTISTTKVKTIPLEKILNENLNVATIDFMSIDAEGHDVSVLKSNNWEKYRPSLIIVESNHEFFEIRAFMDTKDYLHVFNNLYNAVFVDKRTQDKQLLSNLKW